MTLVYPAMGHQRFLHTGRSKHGNLEIGVGCHSRFSIAIAAKQHSTQHSNRMLCAMFVPLSKHSIILVTMLTKYMSFLIIIIAIAMYKYK